MARFLSREVMDRYVRLLLDSGVENRYREAKVDFKQPVRMLLQCVGREDVI